jgi:hypothetical protein
MTASRSRIVAMGLIGEVLLMALDMMADSLSAPSKLPGEHGLNRLKAVAARESQRRRVVGQQPVGSVSK